MPHARGSKLFELPTYSSVTTARLKSLYSDLSHQKASNPTAFGSNMEWWKRTLVALVAHRMLADAEPSTHTDDTLGEASGGSTVTSGKQLEDEEQEYEGDVVQDALILHVSSDLAERLRCEGVGRPLGLASVIAEQQASGALIPLDTFLNSSRSINDTSYVRLPLPGLSSSRSGGAGAGVVDTLTSLAVSPLWWAFEQLGLVDADSPLPIVQGISWSGTCSETESWRRVSGPNVVLALVERRADEVAIRLHRKATSSPADALYSYDSLRREFEDLALSKTDVRVIVRYLARDSKVLVEEKGVIKYIGPSLSPMAATITTIDVGILELKTGVEKMEQQIEVTNKRIDEKTKKIGEYLRANRKEAALIHLRIRKLYEDVLRKRLGSLETLHSTLIQVEASAQDVEIVRQFQSSTATLRALLAHPSLQRENVRATMDALAEAREEQKEIDEEIQLGFSVANAARTDVDEEELEKELEQLVEDERKERERRQTEEVERRQAAQEREHENEKLRASGPVAAVVKSAEGSKLQSDSVDTLWQQGIKTQEPDSSSDPRSIPVSTGRGERERGREKGPERKWDKELA